MLLIGRDVGSGDVWHRIPGAGRSESPVGCRSHFTLVQCGRSCKVVDDHRHLHHTDSLKRQIVASCLFLSYSGLKRKRVHFLR
ncbi:hypothetical protein Pmani_031970 [Petrolisthes manimaculis]|uniref:Uncharacterized protein n=1 Tax=Petrolisthes manimaculis TaxID=1843537 RepID=A0AAE1NTI7_9EUCA|nr:hypothetical protein Pmani_031970 [Petrolisthes manimaculis]